MNAEQCKAICDKLNECVGLFDTFMCDEIDDVWDFNKVYDATACLSGAMDRAQSNLYNLLSDDEKRKFDLL